MEWANSDLESLNEVLRRLEPRLSPAYYERRREILQIHQLVAAWTGRAMQGAMAQEIQAHADQETFAGRKQLVRWVNGECRLLGLAVACPKTGRPSLLMTDTNGGRIGLGSFKFESVDAQGHKVRPCNRSALPELVLVPDVPERAHSAHWARHVGQQGYQDPPRGRE